MSFFFLRIRQFPFSTIVNLTEDAAAFNAVDIIVRIVRSLMLEKFNNFNKVASNTLNSWGVSVMHCTRSCMC